MCVGFICFVAFAIIAEGMTAFGVSGCLTMARVRAVFFLLTIFSLIAFCVTGCIWESKEKAKYNDS